jgi:hypothetical protein
MLGDGSVAAVVYLRLGTGGDAVGELPVVMVRCSRCDHENTVGAHFCNECGASLDAVAVNGESAGVVPSMVGGGRYRVERLLGEGARKRVFAAQDSRLGRSVAVAVIKTKGLDTVGRERIDREAPLRPPERRRGREARDR